MSFYKRTMHLNIVMQVYINKQANLLNNVAISYSKSYSLCKMNVTLTPWGSPFSGTIEPARSVLCFPAPSWESAADWAAFDPGGVSGGANVSSNHSPNIGSLSSSVEKCQLLVNVTHLKVWLTFINPLNPKLNPICYLLALLGAHHFLHVSRIRVKLLTFRRLMSYIWSTYSWCF